MHTYCCYLVRRQAMWQKQHFLLHLIQFTKPDTKEIFCGNVIGHLENLYHWCSIFSVMKPIYIPQRKSHTQLIQNDPRLFLCSVDCSLPSRVFSSSETWQLTFLKLWLSPNSKWNLVENDEILVIFHKNKRKQCHPLFFCVFVHIFPAVTFSSLGAMADVSDSIVTYISRKSEKDNNKSDQRCGVHGHVQSKQKLCTAAHLLQFCPQLRRGLKKKARTETNVMYCIYLSQLQGGIPLLVIVKTQAERQLDGTKSFMTQRARCRKDRPKL